MERIFPGTINLDVTVRVGLVYPVPNSDTKVKVTQIITPPNHPWDTLFRDNPDTEGDDLGADDEVTEPVLIRYKMTDGSGMRWIADEFSTPIEEFIRAYIISQPL